MFSGKQASNGNGGDYCSGVMFLGNHWIVQNHEIYNWAGLIQHVVVLSSLDYMIDNTAH